MDLVVLALLLVGLALFLVIGVASTSTWALMGDVESDKKRLRSPPLERLEVEVGTLSPIDSCSRRLDCSRVNSKVETGRRSRVNDKGRRVGVVSLVTLGGRLDDARVRHHDVVHGTNWRTVRNKTKVRMLST